MVATKSKSQIENGLCENEKVQAIQVEVNFKAEDEVV
jgi:hypothetical protein